jgi:hypothetical protein
VMNARSMEVRAKCVVTAQVVSDRTPHPRPVITKTIMR